MVVEVIEVIERFLLCWSGRKEAKGKGRGDCVGGGWGGGGVGGRGGMRWEE